MPVKRGSSYVAFLLLFFLRYFFLPFPSLANALRSIHQQPFSPLPCLAQPYHINLLYEANTYATSMNCFPMAHMLFYHVVRMEGYFQSGKAASRNRYCFVRSTRRPSSLMPESGAIFPDSVSQNTIVLAEDGVRRQINRHPTTSIKSNTVY